MPGIATADRKRPQTHRGALHRPAAKWQNTLLDTHQLSHGPTPEPRAARNWISLSCRRHTQPVRHGPDGCGRPARGRVHSQHHRGKHTRQTVTYPHNRGVHTRNRWRDLHGRHTRRPESERRAHTSGGTAARICARAAVRGATTTGARRRPAPASKRLAPWVPHHIWKRARLTHTARGAPGSRTARGPTHGVPRIGLARVQTAFSTSRTSEVPADLRMRES